MLIKTMKHSFQQSPVISESISQKSLKCPKDKDLRFPLSDFCVVIVFSIVFAFHFSVKVIDFGFCENSSPWSETVASIWGSKICEETLFNRLWKIASSPRLVFQTITHPMSLSVSFVISSCILQGLTILLAPGWYQKAGRPWMFTIFRLSPWIAAYFNALFVNYLPPPAACYLYMSSSPFIIFLYCLTLPAPVSVDIQTLHMLVRLGAYLLVEKQLPKLPDSNVVWMYASVPIPYLAGIAWRKYKATTIWTRIGTWMNGQNPSRSAKEQRKVNVVLQDSFESAVGLVGSLTGPKRNPLASLGLHARVAIKIPEAHLEQLPSNWLSQLEAVLRKHTTAFKGSLTAAYLRRGCIEIVMDMLQLKTSKGLDSCGAYKDGYQDYGNTFSDCDYGSSFGGISCGSSLDSCSYQPERKGGYLAASIDSAGMLDGCIEALTRELLQQVPASHMQGAPLQVGGFLLYCQSLPGRDTSVTWTLPTPALHRARVPPKLALQSAPVASLSTPASLFECFVRVEAQSSDIDMAARSQGVYLPVGILSSQNVSKTEDDSTSMSLQLHLGICVDQILGSSGSMLILLECWAGGLISNTYPLVVLPSQVLVSEALGIAQNDCCTDGKSAFDFLMDLGTVAEHIDRRPESQEKAGEFLSHIASNGKQSLDSSHDSVLPIQEHMPLHMLAAIGSSLLTAAIIEDCPNLSVHLLSGLIKSGVSVHDIVSQASSTNEFGLPLLHILFACGSLTLYRKVLPVLHEAGTDWNTLYEGVGECKLTPLHLVATRPESSQLLQELARIWPQARMAWLVSRDLNGNSPAEYADLVGPVPREGVIAGRPRGVSLEKASATLEPQIGHERRRSSSIDLHRRRSFTKSVPSSSKGQYTAAAVDVHRRSSFTIPASGTSVTCLPWNQFTASSSDLLPKSSFAKSASASVPNSSQDQFTANAHQTSSFWTSASPYSPLSPQDPNMAASVASNRTSGPNPTQDESAASARVHRKPSFTKLASASAPIRPQDHNIAHGFDTASMGQSGGECSPSPSRGESRQRKGVQGEKAEPLPAPSTSASHPDEEPEQGTSAGGEAEGEKQSNLDLLLELFATSFLTLKSMPLLVLLVGVLHALDVLWFLQ